MTNAKKKLGLLICLALFLTALMLSLFFSRDDVGDFRGDGSGHIVLSEVLASNRTYPGADGAYRDFIEVRNLTATPTDLSGYMLSDALDSIGYTFPRGTVIPAYGYIAVWCDKNSDTGEFAAFGISKTGGETIYLYNSANVMVDSVTLERMNDNMSLIRQDDGSWAIGTHATPGFANTEEGYQEWLKNAGALESLSVVISEVMTANNCTVLDAEGHKTDWVELWNTGDSPVDLTGAYLSDDPLDAFKWQFPSLILQAGERTMVRCAGSGAAEDEASFALPRSGCTVVLTGTQGNTICTLEVPEIGRDCSWALQEDGSYAVCSAATPGYENTQEGYAQWLAALNPQDIQIAISEVMTANYSTIVNSADQLCDWVELQNIGTTEADLTGLWLSDDPDFRAQYQLTGITLLPGETVVIPCGGSTAAYDELPFNLKKSGCTLILTGTAGNILTTLDVPALENDRSWQRQSDGSYIQSDAPSPGYANNEAGRSAFLESQVCTSPLMITEVMPSNASFLQQSDGKNYDWVELRNVSDTAINLSDYCVSNDPDFPTLLALPDRVLEPGERVIIICCGSAQLSGSYIYAPFTLSRQESWFYVARSDGSLCDYLRIYNVPYQGSVGRVTGKNGTYYFTEATPGTENGTGVAFLSAAPTIVTQDGVFDGVDSVSVEISGSGPIRYTLDGSMPDWDSPLYTGPIQLTATTVVRAAVFEDGKLPSEAVTGAYIINENHTLPVISIAVEPDEMFGGAGLYVNYYTEREIRCNLKLFENGEGFDIDCGIKMFGHMGLTYPKKSFKVNFRGRYGEDMLEYPVYGEDGPQYYDSLVIRSGQDYPATIFRDELFTSLAREAGDYVVAQRDKFCILYINGKYWGIYCMKEAFSETLYATHYDVSQESVEIVQAPVDADSEMFALMRYMRQNDMTDPEVWEYVTSQIDIDSFIDWIIFEGYCTNSDVQQNLRYFRSTETGNKWQCAFYDLDWGWYFNIQFNNVLSPEEDWQHLALTRNMMENPECREKFLARLSYLLDTTLSDENVLARIDYYTALLDPEVRRERDRWGSSYEAWQGRVQEMKDFLADGHIRKLINKLYSYIGLTKAEAETYFGRWLH